MWHHIDNDERNKRQHTKFSDMKGIKDSKTKCSDMKRIKDRNTKCSDIFGFIKKHVINWYWKTADLLASKRVRVKYIYTDCTIVKTNHYYVSSLFTCKTRIHMHESIHSRTHLPYTHIYSHTLKCRLKLQPYLITFLEPKRIISCQDE